MDRVQRLRDSGWKATTENIKKEFGMNSTQFRDELSINKNIVRMAQVDRAKKMRDEKGMSTSDIAKKFNVNESTVRGWFDKEAEENMLKSFKTAEYLKDRVDKSKHGMIDVGKGVEVELGISEGKLNKALLLLKDEGYNIYGNRIPQPTNPNQSTTQKILAKHDVPAKATYDFDKIETITDYISRDNGETFEKKFNKPASMDSKRLAIRYAEDGGIDKDGVIELRRGVPDLSLGNSKYAQVRILVDGTHYLKGMAVYAPDTSNWPKGVDVMFNTNKHKDKTKMEVLKEIKKDPDNPFGALIKDADKGGQYWYTDKDGKKKLGLINKHKDEGDWTEWKDSLPAQFLSKQPLQLAEKQLKLAKISQEAELDDILSLNNNTIKKYYLNKFADECDSKAVDLKAAALPGQKYHVIIPLNAMGDKQIYAPKYENGTKLALIRYPHAGTFEIPILTVNNKNAIAKKYFPNLEDAVCISSKVAEQLSGADFDGDTVMCIPTHDSKGRVKISSREYLKDLKNFNNKDEYGCDAKDGVRIDSNGNKHYYRNGIEFKPLKKTQVNNEMGIISNLITDMTLAGGATDDEITRAAKHSMVIIDAEKHKLDYKSSERDNRIDELKKKYQPKFDKDGNLIGYGGASTIISKSKSEEHVPKRRGQPKVNIKGTPWYDPSRPEGAKIYNIAFDENRYYAETTNKKTKMKELRTIDGKKITYDPKNEEQVKKYRPIMSRDKKTGELIFTNQDGTIKYKKIERKDISTKMAETDNAETLISFNNHPMERLYADYANSMKALANKARKIEYFTPSIKKDPQASKIYSKEISELKAAYNEVEKNKVKERAALRLANSEIKRKMNDNPDISKKDLKKIKQQSITKYRSEVNAISRRNRFISINDKQWEAIQSGAISNELLKNILNNTDPDLLRERAMPKASRSLSQAQINRIKAMKASNFTLNDIAKKMHISPSTVSQYLKGVK